MSPVQPIEYIENKTYDEIAVGATATLVRTLRPEDIQMFAIMSGDINPAHVDPEYAHSSMFHEVIAHGMWGGALISTVLGTQFPGPGTIYIDQTLHFSRPVRVGDTLTVKVTCQRKFDHNHHMILDCLCTNQDGHKVISGTAEILAPVEKVKRLKAELLEFKLAESRHSRYQHLLDIPKGLSAIAMAVVHPVTAESLKGALLCRDEGLIVPTLVGPDAKIRAMAEQEGLSLEGCRIIDVPHFNAAVETALELACDGQVEALMKGALSTGELMDAVAARDALRTGRAISHVFLMDVPAYPRMLMITDAMINFEPTLEDKADIVQNAIDLARMLNIPEPKVAILAAVETINPKMRATLDAAALCKMADRSQITGGVLDGPLGYDNAISIVAARAEGINSAVAGQADILLVPDVETGTMLAKQLEYLADALAAGIVLGTKVPIVLPRRADSAETRAASTAVAVVIAHARRKQK